MLKNQKNKNRKQIQCYVDGKRCREEKNVKNQKNKNRKIIESDGYVEIVSS